MLVAYSMSLSQPIATMSKDCKASFGTSDEINLSSLKITIKTVNNVFKFVTEQLVELIKSS